MGVLFFLLVCAVLFTWLLARSLRAGYGKAIFYVAWVVIGTSVVVSIPHPAPPLTRYLVQAWSYSLVVLPAWWLGSALLRHSGGR